jgi:hypothetical protein
VLSWWASATVIAQKSQTMSRVRPPMQDGHEFALKPISAADDPCCMRHETTWPLGSPHFQGSHSTVTHGADFAFLRRPNRC